MTLSYEKEVLGFYLSGHPLAQHKHDLLVYSKYRLDKLPKPADDPRHSPLIRVAGMISSAKKLVTKEKKEQYARFKLEDLFGEIEVVVFPKSYKNGLAKYIVPNNIVVVKGRLAGRDSQNELLAEEIMSLDEAKQWLPTFAGNVHIKMTATALEDELLDNVKKVISTHPGSSPVVFEISTVGQGEYCIETQLLVKSSDKFLRDIEKLLGSESVELHF